MYYGFFLFIHIFIIKHMILKSLSNAAKLIKTECQKRKI